MSTKREIALQPIGVIHTPFSEQDGTPIQPGCSKGAEGTVVVDEPYRPALRDLEGFERVWLVFQFHRAGQWKPLVTPYRDVVERGLFATRAPVRPNPIGISVVRLLSVAADRLVVADVDMLDGTPLLDIKPYVPEFDAYPDARAGWLETAAEGRDRADGRFG